MTYKEIANIINETLVGCKYVTIFTDYKEKLHISKGAISPFQRFGEIEVPWECNEQKLLNELEEAGIHILRIKAQSSVYILGKEPFNKEIISSYEIRNL